MVICGADQTLYRLVVYEKEYEFEKVVISLADAIFGPSTIYIDLKKRVKLGDVISIPDGYLIDFAEPKKPRLFIVENEIAKHDPVRHIGNQMLKFATSFKRIDDVPAPERDRLLCVSEYTAHRIDGLQVRVRCVVDQAHLVG